MSAIDNGFTSVMMDGSLQEDGKTPASYEYNVKVTAEVVKMAHARNVSVEGELGCLGSLESGMGEAEDGHGAEGALSHDQLFTDPDEAERFVAATQFMPCCGNRYQSRCIQIHTKAGRAIVLAMDRIEAIHKKLPNTHLVMHGSSSVPQDLQDIINQFGGKNQTNVGSTRRRNPTGNQERRSQDQCRHRLPTRYHGSHPQSPL